jgi:HSP20 family protein
MAKEKVPEKQEVTRAEKTGQEIQVQKTAPARALSPFEEMDQMLENFIRRGWMRPFHWELPSWRELTASLESRLPRVDVVDRPEEVVVRAEVPGVEKENLDVSLADNTITIKGSTSHEEKEEKGNYYRSEMSRGSFTRTITLPADVDGSKTKATFKNGIVEVTMPKVAAAKRRTIKVE